MKVYTYYEPISHDAARLVTLWKNSWKENGWEPVVLMEKDVVDTPEYRAFYNQVSTYPTVNDRRYENACYIRWWIISQFPDGGILTDFDIINLGITPDMITKPKVLGYVNTPGIQIMCGTQEGFQWWVQQIATINQQVVTHTYDNRPHMSDMFILSHVFNHTQENRFEDCGPQCRLILLEKDSDVDNIRTLFNTDKCLVHLSNNFVNQYTAISKVQQMEYLIWLKKLRSKNGTI